MRGVISRLSDSDSGPALLQASLLIVLVFLLFLIPTFEPGQELALFLSSFAIVILSIISSHYSKERTKLIREQNEMMESQMAALEELKKQSQNQTDLLNELPKNSDEKEKRGSENEIDGEKELDEGESGSEKDENEIEKETTD